MRRQKWSKHEKIRKIKLLSIWINQDVIKSVLIINNPDAGLKHNV